ncbi:DUF2057 domain-containing protein [Marinomonas sp. TI.3.20]|uniref:YccT family protein n=1 Tax=Marinomonas sp. TI.3.20 TaxID=3121296 RepID=UPI00311DC6BD
MRFKNTTILASSILLGAITTHAVAAEFKVPVSYEIMYVDLKDGGDFGSDFKVDLKPGHHQIVVRYHQSVRNSGNLDLFKSEPIIIDLDMKKDVNLELKAPYIRTDEKASNYADKPTFTIVNTKDGSKVDYKERILPFKSGFQPTRDYLEEIKTFTGVGVAAAANSAATYAPAPAPKSVTEANEFQMLQFWFNKSDEATRKDFRIWMVDNTHQPKAKNTQFEMLTFWFNKATPVERKAFQVWLVQ